MCQKSLLVFPNYGYQLTTTKESNIRDVDVAPEFIGLFEGLSRTVEVQKKAEWVQAGRKNLEKKGAKYAQSLLDLRGNDFVICNDYGFPINPDSYAALVRRGRGKKRASKKFTRICSGTPSSVSCCPIQTSVWQRWPQKPDTRNPARPLQSIRRSTTGGVMRFGSR